MTIETSPNFYQEDLLSSFKSAYGFSINFPDITIWKVIIKISVAIKWAASVPNTEAAGVIVSLFVDDPVSQTLASAGTHPYMERYMYWRAHYYNEAVMMGERAAAANNVDYLVLPEIVTKTRRRFSNIEDTLLLQVAPFGSAIASLNGLSWSSDVLLSLGKK